MSKVNLKDNIWIEGFDKLSEMQIRLLTLPDSQFKAVIYDNKTSEIPEDLVKEICELQDVFNTKEYIDQNVDRYKNYKVTEYTWYDCTAKESIQSACPEKYCIIYKTN